MLVAFFFILGLAVGSFLNVVIYRFGFSERASARSRCAQCGHTLSPYELIPLVSHFALRGRCGSCGSRLSLQYPLVEALVGVLFVLTYLLTPEILSAGGVLVALGTLGFWASLVAVVVYDIRHTLIPLPFI